MANHNILENPEFTDEIRKLQTTDKAHADVFNGVFENLLNNDVYLKKLADSMVKKETITHDIAEDDPEKIPGADVTAGLQDSIYSIDKIISNLLGTGQGRGFAYKTMIDITKTPEELLDFPSKLYFDNKPMAYVMIVNFLKGNSSPMLVIGYDHLYADGYAFQTAMMYNGIMKSRYASSGMWSDWTVINETLGPWETPVLQNNWKVYDPTRPPQYRKYGNKIILSGLASQGTIGQIPVFTLPASYRPKVLRIFSIASPDTVGIIGVKPNGEVFCSAGINTWISFDGVEFYID